MTRIETIVIVQEKDKVLLGFKKPEKKFGNMWNGFGGGLEDKDYGSLENCAVRETFDETGIIPKYMEKRGKIIFKFQTSEQDHEVHILRAKSYEGNLHTLGDFSEYRKFSKQELEAEKIYDKMMPADKHWLPYFIDGKLFAGDVVFGKKDGKFVLISHTIQEVESLE